MQLSHKETHNSIGELPAKCSLALVSGTFRSGRVIFFLLIEIVKTGLRKTQFLLEKAEFVKRFPAAFFYFNHKNSSIFQEQKNG